MGVDHVSWWCSAEGKVWNWEWSPYLGAWLLTIMLVGLLIAGFRRDRDFPLRRKVAAFAGVALLLVATDWPMAAMGAGYLLSVQMARQVLVVLIVLPLLLYGCPPVVGRWLQAGARRRAFVRVVSTPLFCIIGANVILLTINTPMVSDRMIGSPLGSFALDLFWIVAGFLLWFPVQPPAPLTPRLVGPLAMVYLIVQSIAPLPTAWWMTWGDYPLFSTFELAPRVFEGFGPLDDQHLGAAVMQVVGGLVIWSQIAVRFLHWMYQRQALENAGIPAFEADVDPGTDDDAPVADATPSTSVS
ncbi:cytochrome c oxidase assembly protein [Rhabdothermincola salaria]|uniref:cytochrome c oxidase assembly protein n=1 Tax=Rhabdothermincola salaria TaxID=2903142 RepID=UPI001E4F6E55|nr:cytochrome c oxidase assembly protein [Rhabdothermincola salaria]MCD9624035.1 cytochrome c oxidase assembly protein [Rhabdothermincola salaria]